MNHGSNPTAVFVGMAVYLAVLVGIVLFSRRWAQRRRQARDEALSQGLTAAGGKLVSSAPPRGYYGGAEFVFELGSQRVHAQSYPVSRYYYRTNVRVETPSLPAITVIPEGKVERFGKAIGLNREVQTGDPSFDDVAYVDTIEEEAVVKQVLDSAAVRDGIRRILELGYKVQLSTRGLEAFHLFPHGTPPDVSRIGEVAALLGQIAGALPRVEPGSFRGQDSWVRARAMLFVFLWIPLLVAAGAVEGVFHSPGARTLNIGHKGIILGAFALTAWVVYVVLIAMSLRGRSYALRALVISAAFGLLGIPTCGVMGSLVLNQALDGSPAEDHAVTILATSLYKGECRVTVTSWVEGDSQERFPVSCKEHLRLHRGGSLTVRSHAGALGMPWVEPIHPPTPAD